MRRLLSLVLILFLYGAKYPDKPINYVSDFAGVIDDQYEQRINALLAELKAKTGAEVAVVTIESSGGEDFVMYGVNLFKKWGIGEKGKDNGVLVVDFVKDRYIRIEVGYGLEGILPDGLVGEIRDKFYRPYLSKGDYNMGHYVGAVAIASKIADAYHVKLDIPQNIPYPPQSSTCERGSFLDMVITIFTSFVVIVFIVLYTLMRISVGGKVPRRRSVFWGGFGTGGGFSGGFGGFGGGASGGAGAGGHY